MNFLKRPVAMTVAMCVTSGVFAQSTQNAALPTVVITDQKSGYQSKPSTIGSKTDTPNLEVAQSVQVVPREVIEDQSALTLTEAVRNVAGVGSDFGFNGSAQPLLVMRGFSSQSMTASGQMSGGSTYYLNGVKVNGLPVNMANVESVEVVKGPSSVLYGRAEPGGLINVVPRALTKEKHFGFEQTIGQYGLSRTAFNGSGALNEDKTLLGRFSVSNDQAKSNRDFVENKLNAFSGTLAWVPNAVTKVAVTYDHNEQKYRTDFGVPAIGNRPANIASNIQYNNSPELSGVKSNSLVVDAQTEIANGWTLKGRVAHITSKTHEVDIWPWRDSGYYSGGNTCLAGSSSICRFYYYARPDGNTKLDQATASLTGDVNIANLKHKFFLEIDQYSISKTGLQYTSYLDTVSIANPGLVAGGAALDAANAGLIADYESHSKWTSFTIQDQVNFGNGWHAVAALRKDQTEAVFADKNSAPAAQLVPNKESHLSPRLGLVWEFAPKQSVYAQYQEALATANGRKANGAPLDSETAQQKEVGWKASTNGGRLDTTVAYFELTKNNIADYAPPTWVPTTVGAAESRGLEFDAIGKLTSKFSLIASYAHLFDAEYTKGQYKGYKLANAATNSGSLWGRYAIDGQWSAGAGVFAQGQRQADYANTVQMPGYSRVDAMTAYAFKENGYKGTLQFNLKNVFNRQYYSSSHQIVTDWIQPGSPRTASVTLRLDI
jgi:iron complex outermembrane receptor protein